MMKKLIFTFVLPLFFTFSLTAQSDDATGYDGDNFSLEGAIELFKQSKSLENFEEKINSEKNNVNNLDLNKDGDIDYVRVEDHMDGDVHAIVLQVPVNEKESQDIAVIEIEKTGKETAVMQVVGNEEVFGEEKIVEPFEEEVNSSGKGGPNADFEFRAVVVNVFFWRPVRVIYAPTYRPWVSPYRWRVYPRGWRPWRPVALTTFRTRTVVFRPKCRVVTTRRVVRAKRIYTPVRRSSVTVTRRTTTVRTTKRKNGTIVKGKRTTTTVKKKNGRNKTVRKKRTKKVRKRRN